MDIIESRTGGHNDKKSRIMDLATLKFIDTYDFQWPVNVYICEYFPLNNEASIFIYNFIPDKNLLCVVGDDTDTVVASADSGKNIATLKGHIDYSFACCWSPDGRVIATGNQGAVRSLHFSEDGRYLAMAEPADFVHIFDAHTFDRSQVIDLFGEIAGVTFTPDTDGLYIANADENYG
ncbi:2495_t:CDS:2, partial [Racocetra fulgida]